MLVMKKILSCQKTVLKSLILKRWNSGFTPGSNNSAQLFNDCDRSVTYHYLQNEIMDSANLNLEPMSLAKLVDISLGKNNILNCARMLQKQLPLRLAKSIVAFHKLPFIVASNPSLLQCQELYLSAYHLLKNYPEVVDSSSEDEFSCCIQDFLDQHKEVISLLSQGFKEAGKYMEDKDEVTKFLDEMMKSRLGIRLLCDHYLQLPLERKGYVGSIETKFSPKYLLERKGKEARAHCDRKFGSSPDVRLVGHLDASFMYISPPLDYILNEIFKNSMRAVMEFRESLLDSLPPLVVTIVNNEVDFGFRISDKGGGIKHDVAPKVFEYGFSSPTARVGNREDVFDVMTENRSSGVMFGFGFGLPVCKAFIEHLGGDLKMFTMQGYGTDIYIRLPHIEGKEGNFLI